MNTKFTAIIVIWVLLGFPQIALSEDRHRLIASAGLAQVSHEDFSYASAGQVNYRYSPSALNLNFGLFSLEEMDAKNARAKTSMDILGAYLSAGYLFKLHADALSLNLEAGIAVNQVSAELNDVKVGEDKSTGLMTGVEFSYAHDQQWDWIAGIKLFDAISGEKLFIYSIGAAWKF